MSTTESHAAGSAVPGKLPRENLVRALGECPTLTRSAEGEMPTLEGHFAVWNRWTEINSAFEGHFMERFAPGSMTKTMSEGRERMRVLFQHGRDPQIGDKPLGPILRLEPDDTGAAYSVPLLDTAYNREIIPGLKAGLYGASFRFEVISEEFDQRPARSEFNPLGLPERTVTEARVREFGPVTFPAYADATAGVRSMTDRYLVGRLMDDPERFRELLDDEIKQRRSFHISFADIPQTASTATPIARTEPEPSEATTPTTEPEPSEATTPREPGVSVPHLTREEFLECISKT